VNVIVVVAELWVVPANVIDQLVPDANPLSLNVTAYCPGTVDTKTIPWLTGAPWTVTDPELGLAVYPVTAPTL
jgi:hypothetical protein